MSSGPRLFLLATTKASIGLLDLPKGRLTLWPIIIWSSISDGSLYVNSISANLLM